MTSNLQYTVSPGDLEIAIHFSAMESFTHHDIGDSPPRHCLLVFTFVFEVELVQCFLCAFYMAYKIHF